MSKLACHRPAAVWVYCRRQNGELCIHFSVPGPQHSPVYQMSSLVASYWKLITRTLNINVMLRWTLIFLVVAIIAAILGFGGIAAGAAGIAKILFFVFLVAFVISLIAGAF